MFINGIFVPKSMLCFVEGDGGSGGGDDPNKGKLESLQTLLDKHKGDAMSLCAVLYSKIESAQSANGVLTNQVTELTGKLPKEGAVILTKEEAADWNALKELNKPVGEIKAALDELPILKQSIAEQAKASTLRKAAEAQGWDADVFGSIAGVADLEFEFKSEVKNGKTAEVAYVKTKVDGVDKVLSLTDYFTTDQSRAKHLPSLQKEAADPKRHVKQTVGGTPGESIFDKIRREKAEQEKSQATEAMPLHQRLNMRVPV